MLLLAHPPSVLDFGLSESSKYCVSFTSDTPHVVPSQWAASSFCSHQEGKARKLEERPETLATQSLHIAATTAANNCIEIHYFLLLGGV